MKDVHKEAQSSKVLKKSGALNGKENSKGGSEVRAEGSSSQTSLASSLSSESDGLMSSGKRFNDYLCRLGECMTEAGMIDYLMYAVLWCCSTAGAGKSNSAVNTTVVSNRLVAADIISPLQNRE